MAQLEIPAEITASVWKIMVEEGQKVAEDDTLMILESMKMEIPLTAPEGGVVKSLLTSEGSLVTQGDIVCVLQID